MRTIKWWFWAILAETMYWIHNAISYAYYKTMDSVTYLEEKAEQYEDR